MKAAQSLVRPRGHARSALAAAASADAARAGAALLGLGSAVPEQQSTQTEVAGTMSALWGLRGAALERWERIISNSGIETRHAVLPPQEVVTLSTAQRMSAYERFAPALAGRAACAALKAAGVAPGRVTDLIVVSCTGFAAPGLDVALADLLDLSPAVRRTTIGFMGCFGAISGLRAALGACAADPAAVALVVCCELCSLHMRDESSAQNQVASALFSDGAAAAVVASRALHAFEPVASAPLGRLTMGSSLLLPHGREWMTWRITDAGFAMTLSREVPTALGECISDFVSGAWRSSAARPGAYAVHPGGPSVLDAVDEALELRGGRGIEASRDILRRFGNMSSGTVLMVLQEFLRRGHALPAMLLAFGPGLTIESVILLPDNGPEK